MQGAFFMPEFRHHIGDFAEMVLLYAVVAQLAEQQIFNLWVVGSIPTGRTMGGIVGFRGQQRRPLLCRHSSIGRALVSYTRG